MEKQENRDENHYSDLQNTILYILLKNGGYTSMDNLIESTRISLFELFHTFELNFSNISSFGKYFKSRIGISPTQYRRNEINRQLYE